MQIVAIDGPAGSGKSSVSKAAAAQLGYGYLDTGAAYRALTWFEIVGGIATSSLTEENLKQEFNYQISLDPNNYWVRVGDKDVTEEIRSPEVAKNVSEIASLPEVRSFMKSLTRKLVAESSRDGVIVEGRDITTVVFPEANPKVLLTASEEVRLARREKELADSSAVKETVTNRDNRDSKIVNFMKPADGVVLLDSTELNFEQTVAALVKIIREAEVVNG